MKQRFFQKRMLVFSLIMCLFMIPMVFAHVVVTQQATVSQEEFLTML
jgi:hypothetical protein